MYLHVEPRDKSFGRKFNFEGQFMGKLVLIDDHTRDVGGCKTECDVTRHVKHLYVDYISLKFE